MRTESLEVEGIRYLVKIFHEDRENSSVSVGKRSINIRIPLSLTRDEQSRSILKMKQWAKERIQKSPPPKQLMNVYKDGDRLTVGGKEYVLSISYKAKQSSSARIAENMIHLLVSSELSEDRQRSHVSTLLSRVIARQRLPDLEKRIREINEKHFQANINKIFFKNSRSNWGSCSEKGNLNISTRLLFAPDDVLDYVCIHELAHLTEFNHSDMFWSLVEKAMPDYINKEHWLKQNENRAGF